MNEVTRRLELATKNLTTNKEHAFLPVNAIANHNGT